MCPPAVLLRIEFTVPDSLQPARALLPHVSTLTRRSRSDCAPFPAVGCAAWPKTTLRHYVAPLPIRAEGTRIGLRSRALYSQSLRERRAVYLCCTFPEVAFGGRYPLSLPCGARTFLVDGLSACTRGCLTYSWDYYNIACFARQGVVWYNAYYTYSIYWVSERVLL